MGEFKRQPIIWEEGINEIGKRADTLETVIRIDPRYLDLQKLILFLEMQV